MSSASYYKRQDYYKEKAKEWRRKHPEYAKYLDKLKQLRIYGLTPESFAALLDSQQGRCKLCSNTQGAKNKRLAVDHDHVTGKVRGLLCNACNTMLGMVEKYFSNREAVDAYLGRGK